MEGFHFQNEVTDQVFQLIRQRHPGLDSEAIFLEAMAKCPLDEQGCVDLADLVEEIVNHEPSERHTAQAALRL